MHIAGLCCSLRFPLRIEIAADATRFQYTFLSFHFPSQCVKIQFATGRVCCRQNELPKRQSSQSMSVLGLRPSVPLSVSSGIGQLAVQNWMRLSRRVPLQANLLQAKRAFTAVCLCTPSACSKSKRNPASSDPPVLGALPLEQFLCWAESHCHLPSQTHTRLALVGGSKDSPSRVPPHALSARGVCAGGERVWGGDEEARGAMEGGHRVAREREGEKIKDRGMARARSA